MISENCFLLRQSDMHGGRWAVKPFEHQWNLSSLACFTLVCMQLCVSVFSWTQYISFPILSSARMKKTYTFQSSTDVQQATVDKVALVIYDRSRQLLERFVFAVRVSQGSESDVSQIGDIEYALRAVLIKLSTTEPLLQPLPPGVRLLDPLIPSSSSFTLGIVESPVESVLDALPGASA